ncbi:unnamed protein product [Closterium sp. NIES-53]
MYITLYFIVTRLPDSLRAMRDHFLTLDPTALTVDLLEEHLLAAETSVVAVGAARGTPRTPFFEGCSPFPLAPSNTSATAAGVPGAEDVGAASASAKRRSSKGKGGRGGGGGSGGGGWGSSGGGGGSGSGGSGGSGGGSGGFGGGGGGSGGSGGSGSGGSGGGRTGAQGGGSGGGQRQQQQRRSETPSPQQLHFGDEAERRRWTELLGFGIAIFDLDYDAILAPMYALSISAEGDCYLCVMPDPGIETASLGASDTTLTPLSAPVPVRLAEPSGGPTPRPFLNCSLVSGGSVRLTVKPSPPLVLYELGQVAPPCSCPLLSNQTLLWHQCLGHPSLPRLCGMQSRLLVSGLPMSLPPLQPSPAPPCLPCVEGRQRAAPHSSSFPPTTAPLQTLHMDVWGPARVSGQSRERYFLLVIEDYTRYTTVFPLQSKGGEFSSDLLREFCRGEGILQSFTLLDSTQKNGIAERCIGLVMEVARISMIHATAPHFLWPFAVQYVAHQLILWPHVSLDYATALVAECESASPPSMGGECDLGTDVLEDKQEEFECLAAVVPRFASMLLAPEGDSDAPDIPTPHSYAEAITVPPSRANIVNGMWIFRVKRPPGSPPTLKARYVARGFSQRQGVDYFQTFSPIPRMTTLQVLLHVAAQRYYELHSLDFSTAFLQGSLDEEIYLGRPPGFNGSFPAGTQWSLWRPVYGLPQAPREWHDTLRTTLAALGFAPSTADPSLFLCTDTSLPPFYVLVYIDDLVFSTGYIKALTLVKSELQKRHTCTDLGELRSYLGKQITRDRARHTITLTQSHMVHQVLQRFGFQFSSPQPTPLSTGHSLSAPPSDKSHPHWAELLRSGVAIFDLYYDAILAAMYALSVRAKGDCYLFVLPDLGIEATALGASESVLPGTALAEALHTFTVDSGASHCFFRDSTALTPLSLHLYRSRWLTPQGAQLLPVPPLCSCVRRFCSAHCHAFTSPRSLRRSSLSTMATEPPQVAASAQVSALGTTAVATTASADPADCRAMASLRVLAFDHEGRPVRFDTWLDDLQLYLLSDMKDGVSLFDHVSGAAAAPPTTADSATRSQWLSRDAAARLATCNHLPLAECAHFGQHRTAQALYDAVVARYSSPATAALGRLLLPYVFPDLSAFATVQDLVSHLCVSDARYRTTSSLDPTSLTVDLLEQHLLAAETSAVAGSQHEEIWLRRPPGFTASFPAGTQWSLRRPVYGLCQAPREWHNTLRTTLVALGFAPATADPSLFLCTNTSLSPFYVLVYVDDLVFPTADTQALTLVKLELQKRHTFEIIRMND